MTSIINYLISLDKGNFYDKPNQKTKGNKTDNINETNNLNFDFFKNRNKEIFKDNAAAIKNKEKNKQSGNEQNKDDKNLQDKFNNNIILKLNELIEQDENEEEEISNLPFMKPKDIFFEKENNEEENNTEERKVLVHRPSKNFVWGMGHQAKQKKCIFYLILVRFTPGEYPSVENIITFLEINNIQDIILVNTHKLGLLHLKENAIISNGFNSKHIYQVAKELTIEFKKLKLKDLPGIPSIYGKRYSEWLLVEIGDISIHIFTPENRKNVDLIERWLNPETEEESDTMRRYAAKKYQKKL